MIVSPKSAEAALKASRRALLKPGRWYPARISEATEKQNKAGTRDMIELLLVVTDDGQERD